MFLLLAAQHAWDEEDGDFVAGFDWRWDVSQSRWSWRSKLLPLFAVGCGSTSGPQPFCLFLSGRCCSLVVVACVRPSTAAVPESVSLRYIACLPLNDSTAVCRSVRYCGSKRAHGMLWPQLTSADGRRNFECTLSTW